MTIWTLGQNIGQKLLRTFSRLPVLGLLLAGVCAAQSSVTMTFEGLKDAEPIGQYYNGGLGLLGSGPGPNFGVDFGNSVMVATLDKSNGGSGDFSGNPSGNEIAYFPGGTPVTMNVPAGFSGGISLYYSNVLFTATVTVFSGLNGTGGVLATVPLTVNGSFCNGSSSVNSCWTAAGVSFSGQALSVVFSASAQAGIVGIDNLTLGSVNAPSSTITSLSPSSAAAGSTNSLALTINGTGFASGAVVHWTPTGGQTSNLTNVQVVNSSVITATVPAALLATAGAVQVVVANATGGASPPATFTISGGQTPPVTLTFEGLKDQEPVGNYYIGQAAGSGSGPGPNLGVSFGSTVVASVAKSAGGTGDFTGNPSGKTVATIIAGNGGAMNVPAGFTTGVSFYYSAPTTAGFLLVHDGLNGTGNTLATVQLPVTGTNCNGSTAMYSCWAPIGVAFNGVALSVNGSVVGIDFDNITFAGVTPPATTISALSPASANVGAAALTLTISGTGFVSGAGVRWTPSTGQPVLLSNVQVVSSSSLTASVPASLLAAIGTAQVFVTSPTGADSLPATFSVNSATATSATLTFEGLKTDEPILDFYNGGLGGQGSGPGPNFGISFGPDALGSISVNSGGTGNFDRNPSGTTSAYFVSGPGVLMNVAAGFTSGFSVYYASGTNTGSVQVFDGLNGTGNILATLQLPATGASCDPLVFFSCWSPAGTTFTGVAKSVNFSGTLDGIGFDNITIGSSVPAGATITSLTPASAPAGSSSVSLSIAGTGFLTGASVMWTPTGGQPTTLSNVVVQSAGLLTATIPTTLLGIPGTAQVVVANLTGGASAPAIFTITGAPPTITTLTPSTISAQAANLNVTIDGTGFASGAIVQWIAKGQTTLLTSVQFVSATRLTTVIPGGLLAGPGSAQISVVNPNGGTSTGAAFTITGTTITPAITSLSPPGSSVQTASLTLTINGSNFVSGATVSWTTPAGTVNLTGVTFVSSTQLTAVVAGNLLAAPVIANVVVTNPNGAASSASRFAVATNTVAITSISPASVPVQVANLTLTINGSGFVTGSTAQWIVGSVSTALTGVQVVSATQMTASVAGVLLSAAGSAQVTVTNPTGSPSNAATFTITAPAPIQATVGTAGTITSPTDQPALTLNLGSPPGAPVTGTAILTFTPDPTVKGVPPNYIDPAAKFSTGTTFSFTVPAGCAVAPTGCPGTVVWPGNGQFAQGTVAGTLTVTVTALNSAGVSVLTNPPPQLVVTVQPLAPVITLGSVKITNVTSTGFNVSLKGYSTTREVTGATFTFAAASGANLTGAGTPITVSFNGLDQSQWFTTPAGQLDGSNFSLSVAFAYTGDPSAIGSVTVTLNSSRGTSGAVTGTQ